ncbi:MAG: hypothetical protein ABIS47_04055 [Acidimicrobiales bacterium]
MFVSDLRHFLDMPDDAPGPAVRMARQLGLIVRAATARQAGRPWVSGVSCKRRPNHRACRGRIAVSRTDVPASIVWRCAVCGDEGIISGWERSPFDLRGPTSDDDDDGGKSMRVVLPPEVIDALHDLLLLDSACERLVFAAETSHDGVVVLTATEDDLDELIGYIAAEANHESDRRRRHRLDGAFSLLSAALNAADL